MCSRPDLRGEGIFKTPKRAYKPKTPVFHQMASLWSDIEDLKQAMSSEEDVESVEFRIDTLEQQVELLSKRLVNWITSSAGADADQR